MLVCSCQRILQLNLALGSTRSCSSSWLLAGSTLYSMGSLKMFWGIYSLKGVCTTIIFILTLPGRLSTLISQFHPQLTSSSQDQAVFKMKSRFIKHHLKSGLRTKVCKEWVTCKSIHKTILASLNNSILLQLYSLETSPIFLCKQQHSSAGSPKT